MKYNCKRYQLTLHDLDAGLIDTGFESIRSIPKYKIDDFENHLKSTYFTEELNIKLSKLKDELITHCSEYIRLQDKSITYDHSLHLEFPTPIVMLHVILAMILIYILQQPMNYISISIIGSTIIAHLLLFTFFTVMPLKAHKKYNKISSLQSEYINLVKYIKFFEIFMSNMKSEYFCTELYF